MATGGSSNSRKLLERKRLHKRNDARKILLETLESRQLMAVGPQLLGIQPDSGSLLQNGQILHQSPRELVLRFDDASGIDPASLSGIRIIRSGEDGVFERAAIATDFSTAGQTLVEFYSQQPGESGNGIQIQFSKVNRGDTRLPVVTNNGRVVNIQLNSNPSLETRVEDLLQVLAPGQSTATSLIYALRLRGSQTIGIGQSTDTTRILTLGGANATKVVTSFGQSSALQVSLTAVDSGNAGLGITVSVTGRDRGGAGTPIVSAIGRNINVEINTNAAFPTTVQEFVDAINVSSNSNTLVRANLVSGIGATRLGALPINYSPLSLSGVLDVEVVPAFVGLGDSEGEVIVRFAEALPDDKYRIEILGQGTRILRDVSGLPFNGGASLSVAFELDLGAQIESIVPQPVTRSGGQLVQNRNQIDVYFNNDDLISATNIVSVNGQTLNSLRTLRNPLFFQNGDNIVFASGTGGNTSAINPNFYQLFFTGDSLRNTDDVRILPNSIRYFPDADRVTLGFSRNLDELVNPANGANLPVGQLRLRIGSNESVPLPPVQVTPATEVADTFAGAQNLSPTWTPGASGTQSVQINSLIQNTTPLLLDFPGAQDDIGNRQIQIQKLVEKAGDTINGTSIIFYNFQPQLGTSATNNTVLLNAITEQQKQRVREVFSIYEQYLGIRFVESANLGLTIAMGDMRAVSPFEDVPGSGVSGIIELNGPGGVAYEAGILSNGQLAAILDTQDFSNSTVNNFGGTFQRTAMQGIGRMLGLGLADEVAQLTIQSFNAIATPGVGNEIVLPGDSDIVHGQYLYRPDSRDIDLYQFTVPVKGQISIETFAERMSSASLLDTQLKLYQRQVDGSWLEIAANDDYFSSDSFIQLELEQGNYIVGVSASGNNQYDPVISDTGLGGRSEGNYQLRMDFLPPAQGLLTDSTGTAIDGDGNGTPAGVFDFWFRPNSPNRVLQFNSVATTASLEGKTVSIINASGTTRTYEFSIDALVSSGNVRVPYTLSNTAGDLAGALATAIQSVSGTTGVTATSSGASVILSGERAISLTSAPTTLTSNGRTLFVDKAGTASADGSLARPFNNIATALSASLPGDVVRIVGNGGADGQLSTPVDNLAYEIGFDTLGRALPDGATFDVPKDVAVMIDAGAVLKLRRARIGVGSTSVNVDRSAGSLMVLGTPLLVNASGAVIKNATGGNASGNVFFTSASDTSIGKNANPSVVGVNPTGGDWGGLDFRNRVDASTATRKDYESVGIFLNSVMHADLRFGGGQVVVDGVSQVVTPVQMIDSRPTVAFSTITASADAAMSATPNSFLESNFRSPAEQGVFSFSPNYERVGPDIHGNRLTGNSLNGLQVRVRTTSASQLEQLTTQTRFDDTDIVHIVPENLEIAGSAGGAVQKIAAPSSALVTLTEQAGGTLPSGVYNYRFTFVDSNGVESPASEATLSLGTLGGVNFTTSSVVLRNLPQGIRNIYRSTTTSTDVFGDPIGAGPYLLVGQVSLGATSFIDNGTNLGTQLSTAVPQVISRLDGRLKIDAGAIVKLQGARIDVSMGGQLIAEGKAGIPVVFTSLIDARYGAGGTFDTANRAGAQAVKAGDWGGVYVGNTSKASLDNAVVAYGGGTTRIEGGFADFNAVTVQQSDVRISESRFEFNANGSLTATDPDRAGRGSNSEGVIFVRGAQPVIVNNTINDNLAPAISINVSSMSGALIRDPGRSTSTADFYDGRPGNYGPLIAGNRLDNNEINGMVVRGGNLTTEGVWDDTDIVHVVQSEIVIPDFHEYGGLRLTSSPTESLVVKLDGGTAGFTATGVPLDNANRIGGSVQILGDPGYPVYLSSLEDCTIGAGFTPEGMPQNDTSNSGACSGAVLPSAFADVIVVMDESGSMFTSQQFSIGLISDIDNALIRAGVGTSVAGANRYGLVGYGDSNELARSVPLGPNGELFGTAAQYGVAANTLTVNGAIEDGYEGIDEALTNYQFRPGAEKFIILVTDEDRDIVTPSLNFNNILARLQAEGVNLQGILGTFIVDQNNSEALAIDSTNTVYLEDGAGGFTTSPNGLIQFSTGTTLTDYVDLVFATGGIVGDISQIAQGGLTAQSFGNALISSIVSQVGGSLAAAGDWRSVLVDANSNDRNVQSTSELETPIATTASANDTTSRAQFLGNLASDIKKGDENQRLGFEVRGVISQANDVDVYSFNAQAGTEVWLDIDRTLNSLDTVVELVDANGRTLALSDDSIAEEANPSSIFKATDLAPQTVNSLRKSANAFYRQTAFGTPKDLYSTNPRDAGMRVVLPGQAGTNNLYHVRVRSSSLRAGDPVSRLTDPVFVSAGLTRGNYQLQLRLSEIDEVPGSSFNYAEFRFARNGLQLVGVPGNSPLLGESGENITIVGGTAVEVQGALPLPGNTQNASAQALGNLLTSNRQAISVAGTLGNNPNGSPFEDVDWYSFVIDYQSITPSGLRQYFSTVIDADYGDGIGRPDLSIYVFDGNGNLILGGLSSNFVDDQASPINGADNSDLSRGSAGGLDPFIGSVALPGRDNTTPLNSGIYYVAITNSQMVPAVLASYTNANAPANVAAVRLQPIEVQQLIAEDHIGSQGHFTGNTFFEPVTPILFPTANSFDPVNGTIYTAANDSIVDHTLADIALFVSQDVGTELTNLYLVNPFTGETRGQVGRVPNDLSDIGIRANGNLQAFDRALERRNAANDQDGEIDYLNIDSGTGAVISSAAAPLQTSHLEFNNGTPQVTASDDGLHPEAMTFANIGNQERGFFVGSRPTPSNLQFAAQGYSVVPGLDGFDWNTFGRQNIGSARPGPSYFTNVLYEFNPNTGVATSAPAQDKTNIPIGTGAGTAVRERGYIETLPIDSAGVVNPNVLSNLLVVSEATTGSATGPVRLLDDGDIFRLLDSSNFPVNFEFDLGPEVTVNYNPAAGRFVRDGMTFQLDGTTYEFDTGSIIVVNALTGAQLADGSTVRIRNASGNELIFEFDNNSQVIGAGNIPVRYTANSTQAQLTQALVAAINGQSVFGVTASSNGNRVSLVGASLTQPTLVTGTGLLVTGAPGITAGNIRIPITETASLQQFILTLDQFVSSSITISFDAGRLNFSGATTGSFTDLIQAGIFTSLGTTGGVSGGSIPVRILAADTAETVAARVTQAINSSGIPGLSATLSGDQITINGGTIANAGPLTAAGVSPGGVIRGVAVIANTLYAVSDRGGLYAVQNPTSLRVGNVGQYITSSYDLIGITFTGLVAGPTHLAGTTPDGTPYSQLLFGIDDDGVMHAFNTAGRLQPVFANGASSIETGLTSATGLALSTLDFNLWHVTGREPVNNGNTQHGIPATTNDTQIATTGGSSLFFGFENAGTNGSSVPTGLNNFTTSANLNYNFPGGAAGAIESQPFDLSLLGAADYPTLYFNYFFETERAGSAFPRPTTPDDYMRDSLRVYVSGEDGQWVMVATNNSERNISFDEYDPQVGNELNQVQELFDNNGQWRQARVPLDAFAGQRNVKLRIEFASAGGFGYGLPGGRGAEIRTIPGNRLVDGETLVVHGETFEINMGISVSLPGGATIQNGDSVTIDGTRYVFFNGTGAPPVLPDVVVPFSATQTAEQITAALLSAIQSGAVVRQTLTGLNFSIEANDVISNASLSGITGDTIRVIGNGQIGDNPATTTPGQDVDMIRIDVDAGATVTISTEAASIGSSLDTFLRVFDSEGRILRGAPTFFNPLGAPIQNDNRLGSTDSLLTFTAPTTGTYYIGLSGAGNAIYNPTVAGNATTSSTGNYNLTIDVTRKLNPIQSGARLQLDGAKVVSVSNPSIVVQGGIGSSGIPVNVTVDMTAEEVAIALRNSIAGQFANGARNVYPIRSGDTVDLTGLVVYDSFDFLTGSSVPSANELSAGPFGATTNFIGDLFGAFDTGTNFNGTTNTANPGTLGGQANAFGGVYLDDFIIGKAGGGEMVLGAAPNTNFIVDPQLSLTVPTRPNLEIKTGPYQFEIRGGQDYGIPLIDVPPVRYLVSDFFTNGQRLANGTAIEFNPASQLVAGTTFTVSDGTTVLTFELDDINDGVPIQADRIGLSFNTATIDGATGTLRSETAPEIAGRFRDLINSPAIQSRLDLTANLLNNDLTANTSPTVVLIGQATVNVPTTVGTTIISTGTGVSNRERAQGQIVVNGVRVRDSAGFGITVDPAPRVTSNDPFLNTNAPVPGSPRNTIVTNTERLAPGAVITNSEFLFNASGGIRVSGEPQTAGLPPAAVPFVRIVNNTIVNGNVTAVTSFTPVVFGNFFFNIGDLAFADTAVAYSPLLNSGPGPIAGLDNPDLALGTPNYTGVGEPLPGQGVVSLGRGGQLVVQFNNNLLTGSGDANPDLVVFQVGDSEEVIVDVSADGIRYTSVGRVSATTPTVDLDAFGFNNNSRLAFVRLTDVVTQGSQIGNSVGADIDAVGAISSVAADNYVTRGTGISVTNNATATILNNAIINSTTGIDVDASSNSTVIGGTIYNRNTNDVANSATLGQFPTVVPSSVPIFVNPSGRNLYPAPSSPVIDSSIDSLQDRPSLVAVKQPLGLGVSPILAPSYDISGQLRVDDPAIQTPFGLGNNVFKDVGAQDRADFVGPSVTLIQPVDNDVLGLDGSPDLNFVELNNATLKFFDIQLIDGIEPSDPSQGSRVDNSTVSSGSVLVYRDNVPLVEGVDYSFGYNNTSGIIRLQPLAGIWRPESVYTIRFINTKESAIIASAGANYTDGDSIDVIDSTGSRTTFEIDTGFIVTVPSSNGIDADATDGRTFIIDDGARRVTFEYTTDTVFTTGNVPVRITTTATPAAVAAAIRTAIAASGLSLTVTDLANGKLQIRGSQNSIFTTSTSGLTVTGQPGVRSVFGLQIPLQAGVPNGVQDGQTFVINRSGVAFTFELDTNGTVVPGNIAVRFVQGANAAQIGAALVSAINGTGLGLSASYVGDGFVRLGGDANTGLNLTNTVLTQRGLPGLPGAIAIPVSALTSNNSQAVAAQIEAAIDAARLPGIVTTLFGSRILVEGALGVAGEGVGQVSAIRDNAGNVLKANQIDGTTLITISLGQGLDYGDAADTPYASKSASGGPTHIVTTGLSLGSTVTVDADAKLTNADSDDGVTFPATLFAAFQTPAPGIRVNVTNTTGSSAFMSFWIDYNQNGVFESSEGFTGIPISGSTTQTFTPRVPSSARAGQTYARFRLSTDLASVSSPTGAARDGEVEDYQISISPNPYRNPSTNPAVLDANGNSLDVNADGFISPIDVLQVINYINSGLPTDLSLPATNVPPYIDVNGDGSVGPLDALLVINYLNSLSPSGEGEEISEGARVTEANLGSGANTVLASNWAAGLENIVMGQHTSVASSNESPAVAADLAIAAVKPSKSEAAAGSSVDVALNDLWGDDEVGEESDSSNFETVTDHLLSEFRLTPFF